MTLLHEKEYVAFLENLKARVRRSQTKAALRVNEELVLLYWDLGCEILHRQQLEGWGTKVIEQLARDLKLSFPNMKGLSSRNLKYMRAFAEAWPEREIVQQAVAQIPWGHNVRLLDKVEGQEERLFYVKKAIENGWSRNVLVAQVESGLHLRQGTALSNFKRTLPKEQSELAKQILKDPYVFDFLDLTEDSLERDLERSLLEQVRAFLLELGVGFAFVGSQVHLDVGGQDFYLDLLFYHLGLRCYVVVELKTGSFKPEYAGKLNFYLSAVDAQVRKVEHDQPTIGLLLCKDKNKVVVEYALRDTQKPMGVASWQLTRTLPGDFKPTLPSVEKLEHELGSGGEASAESNEPV